MAAPVYELLEQVVVGDRTIKKTQSLSSTARLSLEETIADGQTNKAIAFTLDVSQLKAIVIVSDQNVTFETNDGSTPDETIALLAGVPYVWHYQSYHTCLLATDITGIFITNASGSVATLQIEALYDATT